MKLTRITIPLFHLVFIMSIVLGHEDESKSDNVLQPANLFRRKLTDGLTDSEEIAMLDKHNELRGTVASGNQADQPSATDMRKMYWSDELALVAQNYADKCIFEHNPNKNNEQNTFGVVGENLFMTTGGFDPTGSIQAWYNEVGGYTYSDRSCSGVCGHYTQVVSTKSVLFCFSQVQDRGSNIVKNFYIFHFTFFLGLEFIILSRMWSQALRST